MLNDVFFFFFFFQAEDGIRDLYVTGVQTCALPILLREGLIGFESDDAAEETESLLHRSDGGRVVPLGERVVDARGLGGGVRGVRFLVVCETDAHVVSGDLLQKRPLVRSGN